LKSLSSGAVLYDAAGRVISVVDELDVADSVVQAIRAVINRDKFGRLEAASDVTRPRR
jgi:RNA polymerase sigma-70 factor (ECF subfamily)